MNNIKINNFQKRSPHFTCRSSKRKGQRQKDGNGTCERVNIESLADKLKLLRPSKEGQLHKGFS